MSDSENVRRPGFFFLRVTAMLSLWMLFAGAWTVFLTRGQGWTGAWKVEPSMAASPNPKASAKKESVPTAPPATKRVRPPAVAGQFYPADPAELYGTVTRLLAAKPELGIRGARALVVPHAGYMYSAEVAASAFSQVDTSFRRVFILTANHRGDADYHRASIPDVTHFAIPASEIPLSDIASKLRLDPFFVDEPRAHTMHMIELELPFLQALKGRPANPNYEIIPMVLGRMDERDVENLSGILEKYADERTLFVFSIDFSHYYPDDQARKLDMHTVDALLRMDPVETSKCVTDGNQVLLTLLSLARRRSWEPAFILYRNSGDVTGDRSRVVGYASLVFHDELKLTRAEQTELLGLGRRTLDSYVRDHRVPEIDTEWLAKFPVFRLPRGVFVTLNKDGRLRGCIGDLFSSNSIFANVAQNAVNAAVHDNRFPPVTPEELDRIELSITVLGFPQLVRVNEPRDYLKVLRPQVDGVILSYQGRRSTYLPQVWGSFHNDGEQFLSNLCAKQGAPPSCWLDPSTVIYRYSGHEFGPHP